MSENSDSASVPEAGTLSPAASMATRAANPLPAMLARISELEGKAKRREAKIAEMEAYALQREERIAELEKANATSTSARRRAARAQSEAMSSAQAVSEMADVKLRHERCTRELEAATAKASALEVELASARASAEEAGNHRAADKLLAEAAGRKSEQLIRQEREAHDLRLAAHAQTLSELEAATAQVGVLQSRVASLEADGERREGELEEQRRVEAELRRQLEQRPASSPAKSAARAGGDSQRQALLEQIEEQQRELSEQAARLQLLEAVRPRALELERQAEQLGSRMARYVALREAAMTRTPVRGASPAAISL